MPKRFSRTASLAFATILIVAQGICLRLGLPAFHQSALIRDIKQLGGTVIISERTPTWLKTWVGSSVTDAFDDVVQVRFWGTAQAPETILPRLHQFPTLDGLYLHKTRVTERDLICLHSCPKLTVLSLGESDVAEGALRPLSNVKQLKQLWLHKTTVSDSDLKDVSEIKSIEWLRLDETNVTDKGVGHLRGLGHLKNLSLANCRVTDAALGDLKSLKHLEELNLKGTAVSIQGTRELNRTLPQLRIRRR